MLTCLIRPPPTTSRRTSGASGTGRPLSIPPAPKLSIRAPTGEVGAIRGIDGLSLEDVASGGSSRRSPSVGAASARRISFAAAPEAGQNKLWIATVGDSLATGFEYDSRLMKYNVSEKEWTDFTTEVVDAANVPGPKFMWSVKKKGFFKDLKRDLQYDGDVSKVLKKWNRLFKMQRFMVQMELPGEKSADLPGNSSEEKVPVGRCRIVIVPNSERAPSVYSRSSSLTRSVSGEGSHAQKAHAEANAEMKKEHDAGTP